MRTEILQEPESHTRRSRWCGVALAALLVAAPVATAGTLTVAECLEGSDFIANAASARDNGMRRAEFLARLEGDLQIIHAFPPELRWFAKDAEDERFLLAAVQQVFDRPLSPAGHRARFLDACFARSSV